MNGLEKCVIHMMFNQLVKIIRGFTESGSNKTTCLDNTKNINTFHWDFFQIYSYYSF